MRGPYGARALLAAGAAQRPEHVLINAVSAAWPGSDGPPAWLGMPGGAQDDGMAVQENVSVGFSSALPRQMAMPWPVHWNPMVSTEPVPFSTHG